MKQSITTPRLPSGFIEYTPAEQIEFNRLLDIIRRTYERYGFAPLDTPVLELSEVLLAKSGGETEQQVYRFERGRNDLSMRFDLTVPLARYVAQHQSELSFPFRRYQIGKVYRAERAQAGRFREFYQCDIDVIGSNSPVVDAELPVIINEIFEQFGFGEFVVRINNRKVLYGYLQASGLADHAEVVLRAIDKMEKITPQEFVAELVAAGCDDEQVARVQQFVAIEGTNDEILAQLQAMDVEGVFADGLNELRACLDALRQLGMPEHRLRIDLRIARGLNYYTGTVYETNLVGYPQLGSVCSGGRYDDLASHYTSMRLPGVGISIGLTRLFYKLIEAGIVRPAQQTMAQVMVVPMNNTHTDAALAVARQLRAVTSVIVHTEPGAVGKKFKYADKLGVRWVVLLGDDEVAEQRVMLKDMQTGENVPLAADDVLPHIASKQ